MVTQGAKKCHFCSITEESMRKGVSKPPMAGVYVEKGVFTQWILSLSRAQISTGACFASDGYGYKAKDDSLLV